MIVPQKQLHPDMPVLYTLPVEYNQYPCGIDVALVNGRRYHYCEECGGWLEGDVQSVLENSSGPMAGRVGRAYYCRRMGHELGFVGYYH